MSWVTIFEAGWEAVPKWADDREQMQLMWADSTLPSSAANTALIAETNTRYTTVSITQHYSTQ